MPEPTFEPETPPQAQESQEPQDRSLDQLLAEAQAKIEEQREAWLRALADAENARKRAQADVAQARKYALERIAEELLPVMDSLEAALASRDLSGLELTRRQLGGVFERASLGEIAPAPGERFDPHFHQAMATVESDAEPNTVVALMQKGYRLHDRTLRPALVTVARPIEKPAANPISDSNLEPN
jgi:molecular chaperone GrpE